MARTRGVTIYGTYAVIVGGLNAAMNGGALVLRETAGAFVPGGWTLVAFGVGVALCVAGIGAFLLKPWGRTVAIAVAVANLALLVVDLRLLPHVVPSLRGAFLVGRGVQAVINVGILWFFTRPPVSAQFQHA